MKKFFLIFLLIFSVFSFQTLRSEEFDLDKDIITLQADKTDSLYEPLPQPEFKTAFFKMILILIALVALIFFTFWIFKRFIKVKMHQANLTKNIKILEKRPISAKSMLYLVEIDGKRILISESSLEVRKIKDLSIIHPKSE